MAESMEELTVKLKNWKKRPGELHIILNRLKMRIEFELAEDQAGFRAGRGTEAMLCAIQSR